MRLNRDNNKNLLNDFDVSNIFKHEAEPVPENRIPGNLIVAILYCLLIILCTVCYLTSIRTESAFSMRQSITSIFESTVINSQNKQYSDIASKTYIEQFIYNSVISSIYNESNKQYKSLNDNYHYISYYNFFMGLRMTQNRVSLMQNPDKNYKEALSSIRNINYSGNTKTRYSYLDTT